MKTTTQCKRTTLLFFNNKPLRVLALLFVLGSFPGGLQAQDRASASGITVHVTDPRGAIVPKAIVTLYTRDNRIHFKATTDEKGTCLFADLTPG